MRSLFVFLLLISQGLCFSPCAVAEIRDIETVLDQLRGKVATVETISSGFTQEKQLSVFDETIASKGRFLFCKPNKLRWEYLTPIVEGFALDGDSGVRWTDLSDTRTKFSLRSDPVMNVVAQQLLAWATFDLQWLSEEYDISLEDQSPLTLRLVPKREDVSMVLDHLIIEFSVTENTVRRVELHEHGSDFTRIVFEGATVNSPLDNSLFR